MRILLVSLFLVEYAVELANALSQKHQVQLVLSQNRAAQAFGEQLMSKLSPRVTLTLLPYRFIRDLSTIRCAFIIIKLYLVFRPHVVHIQECSNPLNLLFVFCRFRPLVTTIHDVNLHPGTEKSRLTHKRIWAMRILRKYLYGAIIVHGERLKKLFLKRYKKAATQVFAIPHGCLFSFIPDNLNKLSEDAHTVLFFGRMERYKGLEDLIAAEALVSEKISDFKIIVAGEGQELDSHKNKLVGNPHFEIHDRFIPAGEVSNFFLRSAAVVLPYIEASQSGIVAIAFALGKPVIATDVGSLSEIIVSGRNGILVPAGDPLKFSEAVVSMLLNTQERQRMSAGALETANTLLSWTHVANLTVDVYRSKVSQKFG